MAAKLKSQSRRLHRKKKSFAEDMPGHVVYNQTMPITTGFQGDGSDNSNESEGVNKTYEYDAPVKLPASPKQEQQKQ